MATGRDVARPGLGGLKPPPNVILAPPRVSAHKVSWASEICTNVWWDWPDSGQ